MNKIEMTFDKLTKNKNIHECVAYIESSKGDVLLDKGYGNKNSDSAIVLASVTKLYTTACILALDNTKKLSLDDKIAKYLDEDTLRGLHVYKGKEYSFELTISDLLFQVSGLPDYFLESKTNMYKRVINEDFAHHFDDYITWTKQLKPHFKPRKKSKAYYADINFDLLGKIVENICDTDLEKVYNKYIYTPLNLTNTYLAYAKDRPIPSIIYKDERLKRDKLIACFGASGGVISTSKELLRFIKGFFGGELFCKSIFNQISAHNNLQLSFGPIRYAGGYMQIKAGIPFGRKIELLGHSGSTGSFAYYLPEKNAYIAGDVNQFVSPALGVRFAMRLAFSI